MEVNIEKVSNGYIVRKIAVDEFKEEDVVLVARELYDVVEIIREHFEVADVPKEPNWKEKYEELYEIVSRLIRDKRKEKCEVRPAVVWRGVDVNIEGNRLEIREGKNGYTPGYLIKMFELAKDPDWNSEMYTIKSTALEEELIKEKEKILKELKCGGSNEVKDWDMRVKDSMDMTKD